MTTLLTANTENNAISPLPTASSTPRKQLVMNWVTVNGKLECRWIEA